MSAPDEATGSRGEVEALTEALGDIRVAGARREEWWTNDEDHYLLIRVLRAECAPWAEGLLASDWLAKRDAARYAKGWNAHQAGVLSAVATARADERERIAQAIDDDERCHVEQALCPGCQATRIARTEPDA